MRTSVAFLVISGVLAQRALAHTSRAEPAVTPNDSSCVNDPSWTAPQAPFRIHGNTWHVGPRGLGVFLITAHATPGHAEGDTTWTWKSCEDTRCLDVVGFWDRVARRDRGDADALVNPTLCRRYANGARESFEQELVRQRQAAAAVQQKRP